MEMTHATFLMQAFNRIILYERNGLQHGGFDVPGSGALAAMEWSRNSELLALVLREDGEEGEEGEGIHWEVGAA